MKPTKMTGAPKMLAALCSLLLAATPIVVNAQPPSYTATYLGTLGGSISGQAFAINNLGQVVGRSFTTGNAALHATLFSGTGTGNFDLGTLGGASSAAYGINDLGQIVGTASPVSGNTRATLFSGSGSGNLDLGSLGGNGTGEAYSNNDLGQIVGFSTNAGNTGQATLFSGTGSGNLNLGDVGLPAAAYATSIYNLGTSVGQSINTSVLQRATLFSGTGTGNFDLGTLAPLSAGRSTAYGISDAGQIVGQADTNTIGSELHAVLFSGTGSGNTDLGTLGGTGSRAHSINISGQIVGESSTTGNAANHGFVYSGGVMYDLNNVTSNATNIAMTNGGGTEWGQRINDWGQIVGVGLVSGQSFGAIRLDPVDPLQTVSGGGAMVNTKIIGGMNYNMIIPAIDPGNLGTTVSFLGGTVGSAGAGIFGLNRDVNVEFIPPNPVLPLSDIASVTGTAGDTFVLQLDYDETLLTGILGDEANARLGWSNAGVWELAVDGNSGGTSTFVLGAWDSSYGLGTYGVDTSANKVWGVINHNSDFAVWGPSNVPEPGDGNGDGWVDGLDYLLWATHFGDNPAEDPPGFPANGDYNDDGVVNGLDYLVWAANFGTHSGSVAAPEPASFALLMGSCLVMLLRRRR